MGVVDVLVRAREAFDRRDWLAAYDGLAAADDDTLLAADFADLGTAAFLVGRHNDCIQALQRAHRAHVAAGDAAAAVRCAFWLANILQERGERAVAAGWIARAQRMLAEVGEDSVECGFVAFHLLLRAVDDGDFAAVGELATVVTDHGRRFREPDLVSSGLMAQGRSAIYAGRVREGLALLDEAMVGVLAGELSPIFAGHVYCASIDVCQEVADHERAAEWTTALTTWCRDQPGLVPFTGQCALHRGQLMRARGALREAVDELGAAVERYVADGWLPPAGVALAELGDVHRLLGDDPAARAALLRAVEVGHDPQPAQALLALAEGRRGPAAASVRRLLAEPRDPIHRAQVLPGAIEVLLGSGDLDEAAPLVEELRRLADLIGTPALDALASHAAGALLLASAADGALPPLRHALTVLLAIDRPYDAACSRLLLARALAAAGDTEAAEQERAAACDVFAALGAEPALRRAAAPASGPVAAGPPGGLTAREIEVLGLVAAGRSNHQIARALQLSDKTVARHLSNIFGKLDVPSRTAAAAYAFEHRLVDPHPRA